MTDAFGFQTGFVPAFRLLLDDPWPRLSVRSWVSGHKGNASGSLKNRPASDRPVCREGDGAPKLPLFSPLPLFWWIFAQPDLSVMLKFKWFPPWTNSCLVENRDRIWGMEYGHYGDIVWVSLSSYRSWFNVCFCPQCLLPQTLSLNLSTAHPWWSAGIRLPATLSSRDTSSVFIQTANQRTPLSSCPLKTTSTPSQASVSHAHSCF